ncbi:potassium channel family protein [Rhizobium sp. NZLR11]|uniref:potassium channel family protein n=1 Tax=Rhizobium sp. NZLR11 TaxID=2731098 RepID=UPI001C8338EF|nr:potassium channel family protein [Rhizobium sp. NZLR11]MBX5206828.1 two pore domain potassium channel family protein [Rhizobium sp. NZLR11]
MNIGTTWKLHQALDSKPFWALPAHSLFSRYYANCESLGLSRPITDGQTIRVTIGIEMKEYQRTRLSHNRTDAPLSYFRFDAECNYTERTHPRRGVLDCALIGEKDTDLLKPEFRSANQARKWVAAAVSGKFVVWGDDVSTLTDFQNEFVGTSMAIGKDRGRMLYLSVVILTTLGLGDIVPVANASRLLVGLEATSGIFIAGLFLNALAWRASQKADQDEDSKCPHAANPQPQPDEGQPPPNLKPP